MLPLVLDDVDAALLERACAERWQEGPRLEFKRDLPGRDSSAKNEFLKDVAAMANAEGGDLVYGIDEADGAAAALCPITSEGSDDAVRRLGQMLDSSIEPRISGVQRRIVPVKEGFAIVVRVPASYDGPHRYFVNQVSRFVVRNHTHTPDMTYDQLRDSFGRRASLIDRAGEFIAKRLAVDPVENYNYLKPNTSRAIVHVVPLAGIARRVSVDIAALHKNYKGFQFTDYCSWTRSANRNGLALHVPLRDEADYFLQVFRDGSIEAVYTVNWEDGPNPKTVIGRWVGEHFTGILTTYQTCAREMGIEGPGLVSLSLRNVAETVLATSERTFTQVPLKTGWVDCEPLLIQDVAAMGDSDVITRPLMDVVFQSYGVPVCPFYDASGKWRGEKR